MDKDLQSQSDRLILRWGGALTTVLFAAASISFALEGAPIQPILLAAALAVGFGVFTRRAWRRAR